MCFQDIKLQQPTVPFPHTPTHLLPHITLYTRIPTSMHSSCPQEQKGLSVYERVNNEPEKGLIYYTKGSLLGCWLVGWLVVGDLRPGNI